MCKKLGTQDAAMSARGRGGSDVHKPKWRVGAAWLAASGVASPAVLGPRGQLHAASHSSHQRQPFSPLGPKRGRPWTGQLKGASGVMTSGRR